MDKTIKTKVLKTKKEWKEYAFDLETLLLLRPFPPHMSEVDEQWISNYKKWWDEVVKFWFVPEEDEQDDYGVVQKHLQKLIDERDYYMSSAELMSSTEAGTGYRLMVEFYDALINAAEQHIRDNQYNGLK